MKHAGQDALDQLEPLLKELRKRKTLTERKRGIFYRKSRSFLHFREDPEGLFADVRAQNDYFDRYRVTTANERFALLHVVDDALVP